MTSVESELQTRPALAYLRDHAVAGLGAILPGTGAAELLWAATGALLRRQQQLLHLRHGVASALLGARSMSKARRLQAVRAPPSSMRQQVALGSHCNLHALLRKWTGARSGKDINLASMSICTD